MRRSGIRHENSVYCCCYCCIIINHAVEAGPLPGVRLLHTDHTGEEQTAIRTPHQLLHPTAPGTQTAAGFCPSTSRNPRAAWGCTRSTSPWRGRSSLSSQTRAPQTGSGTSTPGGTRARGPSRPASPTAPPRKSSTLREATPAVWRILATSLPRFSECMA